MGVANLGPVGARPGPAAQCSVDGGAAPAALVCHIVFCQPVSSKHTQPAKQQAAH